MKRLKYLYAGTFLLFALLLVIANILQKNREEQSNQGRNVVMNRIAGLVETEMKASGANPEEIVQLCFYDKKDEWQQAEICVKYEGYIKKALDEANKMVDLDNKKIPEDIDYDKIHNLASEAKQKLKQIKPTSIGQALRISGVNPADISLLMVYIKKEYFYEQR